MGNCPREIGFVVQCELFIKIQPSGLIFRTTPIASYTYHVIFKQALCNSVTKKEVIYPDIIMNKYQRITSVLTKNIGIIDIGQSTSILKGHTGNQPLVV